MALFFCCLTFEKTDKSRLFVSFNMKALSCDHALNKLNRMVEIEPLKSFTRPDSSEHKLIETYASTKAGATMPLVKFSPQYGARGIMCFTQNAINTYLSIEALKYV